MGFISDIITDVAGPITGATQAADAASEASRMQQASAQQGIDEQRRQFNALQQLMQPYVQSGTSALGQYSPYVQAGQQGLAGQQAILGMSGNDAQQNAINTLASSPYMQELLKQGETGMLQNASATGGLRGGNLQGALAQYRPAMLNDLINQQYARLGGLSSSGLNTIGNMAQLGQNAAAGVGTAGLQSASNIGNLYNQQGAAQAGGELAQGGVAGKTFGTLANIVGAVMGSGNMVPTGNTAAPTPTAPTYPNQPSMGGGQGLRF